MFSIFEKEDVLALYICADTISGLLAEQGTEGLKVVKSFRKPVDGDSAAALAEALESEKISPCAVCICLSSEHSFLRFADVPEAGDREMRQILSVRMDADMPVPLSELYWDYWTLEGGRNRQAGVVACRRSTVHRYYDVLLEKGFKPQLVTFDALILADMIAKKERLSDESFMVLSQQGNRLFFLMFDGGLRYFRTVNLNRKQPRDWDFIAGEFNSALQYCRDYKRLETPRKLYYLSDDDLPREVRSIVNERFELNGEELDPVTVDFVATSAVKESDGWAGRFLFCTGLLESIKKREGDVTNLLPKELHKKGAREQLLEKVFTYRMLAVVCAGLFLFNLFFNLGMKGLVRNKMEAALKSKSKIEKEVRDFEQRLLWLEELQSKRMSVADAILSITKITPGQVKIEEFTIKETDLTLKGTVANPMIVYDYIKKLSASKALEQVRLDRMNFAKNKYQYEIRCSIVAKALNEQPEPKK